MAFNEIGNTRYYKYKECEKGQVLVEGKFVRSFEGTYGTQFEYHDEKSGDIVVLNAAANLNHKMRFADEGDLVRVIYDGTQKIKTGPMAGKFSHQFRVAIDKEANEDKGAVKESKLDEDDDFSHDDEDDLI